MGFKTERIRFNVKDRGRRFRGQDRNFDTVALARVINSPEVQERVKNRDLVGYWGHWPRVKFGLEPGEAAVVKGKVVNLEPAIVTTYLKAHEDGTIEHESEFLDTAPGRIAYRQYASRVGGFSSAINAPRRGSMQVPESFHGFDYVKEPNYTVNRGYTLDSAGNRIEPDDLDDDERAVLDEVGQYTELVESTAAVLDRVQAEYDLQASVLTQVHEECNELRSQVARLQEQLRQRPKQQVAVVDSVPKEPEQPEPTREQVLDSARKAGKPLEASRFASADAFIDKRLERYEAQHQEEKPAPTAADRYLDRAFGPMG